MWFRNELSSLAEVSLYLATRTIPGTLNWHKRSPPFCGTGDPPRFFEIRGAQQPMVFGKQSFIARPEVSTVKSATQVPGTHKLTLYFRHVTLAIWTLRLWALLREHVCQQPIPGAPKTHLILAFILEAWRHFLTVIPSSIGRHAWAPRNGATVSRLFLYVFLTVHLSIFILVISLSGSMSNCLVFTNAGC